MRHWRAILFMMATATAAYGAVSHKDFGKLPDGSPVTIYTLSSPKVELRVMTFGARVVSLKTPDRHGKLADIVLGYDDLASYVKDNKTYFGVVPGRYANRIAKGTFSLEGKQYHLTVNENGNTLHGGKEGFDRRNWTGKEIPGGVEFTLISPDGDQGFPGALTAHVRYTLVGDKVTIHYSATTDKPTVVNLTNHTYFNLSGAGSGTILNDKLTLFADKMTPVDSNLIPTGELKPVAGTPFDFTHPEVIGARIGANDPQLKLGHGYDHNWIVNGKMGTLRPAARVLDPASGRILEVSTTQPGVQFYTGNFLDGSFSGPNGKYIFRSGLCLETQHYPDSPNHPAFPSTELKPGQTYSSETTWTLSAEK
ncbi:MAG TPA: aldose epimerase family protein [Acidobacteriaceae bacterium]|nr:aldose epimerase family protein [Acidobacteriaceae bacterium]